MADNRCVNISKQPVERIVNVPNTKEMMDV